MKTKELAELLERQCNNGTPDKPISVELWVYTGQNESGHKTFNTFQASISGIQSTGGTDGPKLVITSDANPSTANPNTTVNCLLRALKPWLEEDDDHTDEIFVQVFRAGKQEPINDIAICNTELYIKLKVEE